MKVSLNKKKIDDELLEDAVEFPKKITIGRRRDGPRRPQSAMSRMSAMSISSSLGSGLIQSASPFKGPRR